MTDDTTDEGDESELVNVPRKLLNRILDRVDDLEEELAEYRDENEHDKATIRQDVNEAIEKANEATEREPTESAESDDTGDESESITPMERIIRAGESSVVADITASVRRAKAIGEHFGSWASRAPNGLVIKDNLKNLIETATGERLAWRQVYRACRALEEFTKGAIQFKKHRRHGWMLIAQPEIVARLGRVSSASTG
jgi:hypothetical protein